MLLGIVGVLRGYGVQAVILAGGLGTRLSEETSIRPKPMVEIGGKPILWHIMKIYETAGINDFIVCGGYKSYVIKEFFANYELHNNNVTFDYALGETTFHSKGRAPWKVTILDTGDDTLTGGRLLRASKFLEGETFCMTYGDGLADIRVSKTLKFHSNHKKLVTITGVRAPGRFGFLDTEGDSVVKFAEKPEHDSTWINGGFFVLNTKIFEYIEGDKSVWENEPLSKLTLHNQVKVWKHSGFWQPMDTLRDKNQLEQYWELSLIHI